MSAAGSSRPPSAAQEGEQDPWSWRERLVGVLLFTGLAVSLGSAVAVMVSPPLLDDLRPWWPPLAAIGFVSTAAGAWWLWWRPR